MKKRFSIKRKLVIGFGVVFLAFLVNSFIMIHTSLENRKLNESITRLYTPSTNNLTKLRQVVVDSKMLIKNWVYIDKQSGTPDKLRLRRLHDSVFPAVIGRLEKLAPGWDQVNQALQSLNQVTQGNLELFQGLRNNAGNLSEQADVLKDITGFFRTHRQ